MRFSTIASAAALAPAVVSATYNADLKDKLGVARVHNKCPYDVYLWSVRKGDMGCPSGAAKVLKTGESYEEQYRDHKDGEGVSIKISKSDSCKGDNIDITQLEYFINHANADFFYNFLDVSFVDCLGGNCPGRDKFYLKSGNNGDPRLATAGADKAICPVLSCSSKEECATMAYINPDDVQTKSCEPAADMDFYLCVSSPDEGVSNDAPKPSDEEKPAPSSVQEAASKIDVKIAAAAITPAPAGGAQKQPKIKTEVVYVTEYKYVNAKRHGHGHVHKRFHA
ncbi:uncharacterized protein EI97DRAFT_443095 [Westerdykella ornata]|uniref:Osmotin, thaumatin-like protein n=1 Tax=Westerdykella ornata TaxID=318751 RepID=A0A6A6JH33_WESOR|nr:uncharacterized protein EI97DRAFT_443095 [Westerdykella ornata]KAF2275667.1 hypothetical protein EI97DRAFT_443095 [Westerdykella ornata]